MNAVLDQQFIELDTATAGLTLYGFGVYTSFVVSDLHVRYWHAHLARICDDAQRFLGAAPSKKAITDSVLQFLSKQTPDTTITCRVTVFPKNFNLATPHIIDELSILVTGRVGSSVQGQALSLKSVPCVRDYTQHKITNIAAAMKSRANAKNLNFSDALFCNDGIISEGPTWNIFFVDGDNLITPPISDRVLPGVTRRIFLDLFGENAREETVHMTDIARFDSAFATNAAIGAVSIKSIDDHIFNGSETIFSHALEKYQELKSEAIE